MDTTKLASGSPPIFPDDSVSMTGRLALATDRIPAGAKVNWSELQPGRAYPSHISTDAAAFRGINAVGKNVFAKVYHTDAAPLFDLANSVAAAQLAGRCGLGPQVIGYDAPSGVVVFDWLGEPWRTATCADLRSHETCSAIIKRRCAWRDAPFNEAVIDDVFARVRKMAALATSALPHQVLANLNFFTLLVCVNKIGEAFTAAGSDLASILGDTSISNVMLDDAGGVQLVDFDFAGRGDPLRDVAGFCLEACSYDGDGMETVVEMYLGTASTDILTRVQLLMLVEDFLWATWALCMHATAIARRDSFEFFAYAGARLLRASRAMATIDVTAIARAM